MDIHDLEYSATEIRSLLQEVFPHRKLVLSQFTFFNQAGVARATGETFRRGRRCYRLVDILPIACVLALKEQGIALKSIEPVPQMLQEHAMTIFQFGPGCRVSGWNQVICLKIGGLELGENPLDAFLGTESASCLLWSYDVGILAQQLEEIAKRRIGTSVRHAA